MIKAILACDNGGGVSKGGTIPWPKNTKDLSWFKKNTTNNVVVCLLYTSDAADE